MAMYEAIITAVYVSNCTGWPSINITNTTVNHGSTADNITINTKQNIPQTIFLAKLTKYPWACVGSGEIARLADAATSGESVANIYLVMNSRVGT
jgi:hypothetical protein